MLASTDGLPRRDRVIVALDCDMACALDLADILAGAVSWVKIGMTLYYAQGPKVVYEFKDRGYNVFLDLKFHDIPHQVHGAAASATRNGADMLTMHAIGGSDMMLEAVRGCQEAAADFGLEVPAMLGITVLTSMDDAALAQTGVQRTLDQQVEALAIQAQQAGLSGVVSSPQEARALRKLLGSDALVVTPGVRPAGFEAGDQSRIATPRQAFDDGASYIVVGRPITAADDPLAAFENLASDLGEVGDL